MSDYTRNSVDTFVINTEDYARIRDGFPYVIDDISIAHALGIKNRTFWKLIKDRNDETAYTCFGIPEFLDDGSFKKVRRIQAPAPDMKFVHRVLNSYFSSVPQPDCVTAYVRGKNVADAARKHCRKTFFVDDSLVRFCGEQIGHFSKDKRYKKIRRTNEEGETGDFYFQPLVALQLDLKDYFNTIKSSWIRKFFYFDVGYSHHVSALLATLCSVKHTDKNGVEHRMLPQGSPLSGSLSNLIGYARFGKKIEEYLKAKSPDWVFTIYSDDLTLTHPDLTITQEEVDTVKREVVAIIEASGFRINHAKTRITRSKFERIEVLGCVINEKLNLPRYVYNNAKCLLHNCIKKGWASQLEQCEVGSELGVVQKARGIKEYINQVRPDWGIELDGMFKEALAKHPVGSDVTVVLGSQGS